MALTINTFRIFVSSTFSDMKAERDALQQEVFPELKELCLQHGFRFQAIDLRWGIRDESSLDHQTMKICLDEVIRCQRPPYPNSIVLLGDRYGWQPLAAEIPENEFAQIEVLVSASEKEQLHQWYRKDENEIPVVYCLQTRTGEFVDGHVWQTKEDELRKILRAAIVQTNLSEDQKLKYTTSATEQEIYEGALRIADASSHVFGFFREIKNLPKSREAKDFVDLMESESGQFSLDEDAREKLHKLKSKLEKKLGKKNISSYEAEWREGKMVMDLTRLCKDVKKHLWRIIKNEINQIRESSPLEQEILAHTAFAEDRSAVFVGREEIRSQIQRYLRQTTTHPLVIHGVSGTGKSALMASSIQEAQKNFPEANILYRFIGVTPVSSSGRALLESLCEQIYQEFDYEQQMQQRLAKVEGEKEEARKEREKIILEYTIPGDMKKLPETLHSFLIKVPASKQLIIFFDALDQLPEVDNAQNLNWLPVELPENVRLIMTTLPGESFNALQRKIPEGLFLELPPMPPAEGEQLLDKWLEDSGRTLQLPQRHAIFQHFNHKDNGNPLYLKLAFEEARKWKSYTDDIKVAPDIQGIINDLFDRLSRDENHGKMMVSRSLGYLAAAKNGLTEDELLEVLSRDNEVYDDFKKKNPFHDPPEQKIPVVIWSRLYFDLEPYLTERSGDGTSLIGFYHQRSFGKTVNDSFLQRDDKLSRHQVLADYFENQSLYLGMEDQRLPNLRKLSEQPYHLTHGEMWDQLYHTLTDTKFLEEKNTHFTVFDLLGDYRTALLEMPPADGIGDQRSVIQAFKEALDQASFVLKESPELTFPKLYNRLQWEFEGNALLKDKLENEKRKFKLPWLRLISKPSESPALIRSISGVTDDFNSVTFCAFSPNDEYIFSASGYWRENERDNYTIKKWNAKTGKEVDVYSGDFGQVSGISQDGKYIISSLNKNIILWDSDSGKGIRTFKGHRKRVSTCSISPDGKLVVSASAYGTLKLWNALAGEQVDSFNDDSKDVRSCAFSADSKRVVFGSRNTLNLYDIEKNKVTAIFNGHEDDITDCSFSPNNRFILSSSKDNSLKLWDVNKGIEILTLKGHTDKVNTCAFSPKGELIISGSKDKTLRLWDAFTGRQVDTLVGHIEEILACAFSPDGKQIISASADGTLKLWDAGGDTTNQLSSLTGHEGEITTCGFSHDNRYIISAGDYNEVKIWDVKSCKEHATFEGHTDVILSNNSRHFISTGNDRSIKLWDIKTGKDIATLIDHINEEATWAFSPDGERIISKCENHILKLWDTNSSKEISILKGFNGTHSNIAFSPDGLKFIYACYDKTLKLLDAKTGKEIFTFSGHTEEIRACAFSPDNKHIVSASDDKTLKIWDLEECEAKTTLTGHKEAVTSCAFSPDGKHLLSGSFKILKLWDIETGKEIETLTSNDCAFYIHSCAFSPNGKRIVSSSDNILILWDGEIYEEIATLRGHELSIVSFAFSRDNKHIASACEEGVLKLWDAKTGKQISAPTRHTAKINSCSFSKDNKQIVSASNDQTMKVWDGKMGQEVATLEGHASRVHLCDFSPDGQNIASGSIHTLKLWDVNVGRNYFTKEIFKVSQAEMIDFSYSPDGKRIISSFYDADETLYSHGDNAEISTFKLLDGPTGKHLATLWGHKEQVTSCGFSPDGDRLISVGYDKFILWDPETGEKIPHLENYVDDVIDCVYSPDGRSMVSVSYDKVILWDIETGNIKANLRCSPGKKTVTFSPDGQKLIYGNYYTQAFGYQNKEVGEIKLWDFRTSKEIFTLKGHSDIINDCCFSPDGQQFVTASDDKTLWLWDTEKGIHLATLLGHTKGVKACFFSPDGRNIISAGNDDTIRFWEARTGKHISTLKGYHNSLYDRQISTYSISPNGKRIVYGNEYVPLKLLDLEAGKQIATFVGEEEVTTSAFSPDGNYIIGSAYNILKVWDIETSKVIISHEDKDWKIISCTCSPDGKQIAYISGEQGYNKINILDSKTGKKVFTLNEHTDIINCFDCSPDAQRIVSASDDKTLKFWDARTGKFISTLSGHIGRVTKCLFSPDGRYIISASHDKTLKLWDAKTGKNISTLIDHTETVNNCAYSPDGRYIISVGEDDTIKIWDGHTGTFISTLWGHDNTIETSYSPDGDRIVLGDELGQVLLTYLENVSLLEPIVNPVRLRLFTNKIGEGKWEENVKATCKNCGVRFTIPDEILNTITTINQESNQSTSQTSILHLQDQAFDDPRLLSNCPHCHKPLRFNPFIVDNSPKPNFKRKNLTNHFEKAHILLDKGKIKEAVFLFKEAIPPEPDADPNAYLPKGYHNPGYVHFCLGIQHERNGNIKKADYHLALAVELGNAPANTILEWWRGTKDPPKPKPKPKNRTTLFNEAVGLQNDGKYEEAIQAFRDFLDLKPDYPLAHYFIGECYSELGNTGKAIQAFKASMEMEEEDQWTYLKLGREYRKGKSISEAKFHFKRALELGMEEAEQELEDLIGAGTDTQKTLEKYELMFRLGKSYISEGDYEGAAMAFKQVIQLNPDFKSVYFFQGKTYWLLQQLPEAKAAFKQALKFKANQNKAHLYLGRVYQKEGSISEAKFHFKQALLLGETEAKSALEKLKHEIKKPAAPENTIRKDHLILFNQGNKYLNEKRYEQAISSFKACLDINPDFEKAYYNLGLAYKKTSKLNEAISAYEKAIHINPKYGDAYFNLGLAYSAAGQIEDAIEAYKKACNINQKDYNSIFNLGLIYQKTSNFAMAEKSYKATVRINPDFQKGYNGLGSLYYNQNKLEMAKAWYLKSIGLQEDQNHIHFNLGLIYKKQENFVKARQHFERALRLGYDRAKYMLEKLPTAKKKGDNGWKFWKK